MEADKRLYCGSTEGDFINKVNERLMHLELEATNTDIVAEWRLINMYTAGVWRAILLTGIMKG
jgi:hypothetical protein